MQISSPALVIKVMDVGENDRLLTLLTADYGIVKAFASGAKKLKSRLYASTGMLCYSDMLLAKNKDTYRVRDADLKNSFFKLGCDVATLSLIQYFCELISVLAPVESQSNEYMRLMLNSLYFVNNKKIPNSRIKAIFELRLLSLAGYMPDLVGCSDCGKFEDTVMYFDIVQGTVICRDCSEKNDGHIIIDATILSAMRHIIYSDFDKLFNFTIPDDNSNYLSICTERYLLAQIDRRLPTLNFYNSII